MLRSFLPCCCWLPFSLPSVPSSFSFSFHLRSLLIFISIRCVCVCVYITFCAFICTLFGSGDVSSATHMYIYIKIISLFVSAPRFAWRISIFLMDLLPNRSIPIFTQSMYLRAFYPMRAEMVFNAQRLYVLNMKNYLWLVLLIQIIFTGCMQSVCIGTSILFYSFSTFLLLSILVCCIFFVSHGIYALSRRYVCIWC